MKLVSNTTVGKRTATDEAKIRMSKFEELESSFESLIEQHLCYCVDCEYHSQRLNEDNDGVYQLFDEMDEYEGYVYSVLQQLIDNTNKEKRRLKRVIKTLK